MEFIQKGDGMKLYFSAIDFINSFNSDFEDFKKVYPDAYMKDFITENISFYRVCIENTEYVTLETGEAIIKSELLGTHCVPEITQRIKYPQKTVDEIESKRLNYTFKNILDFLNAQINDVSENTIIQWNGSSTELVELTKALIENGTIKGTQHDLIRKMSNIFNIEIKNPNKLITDIKKRNIGSETLFIDRLKSSLFGYITKENKR